MMTQLFGWCLLYFVLVPLWFCYSTHPWNTDTQKISYMLNKLSSKIVISNLWRGPFQDTSSTRHHEPYHGVHCHRPPLMQAATAKGRCGDKNGGVSGNGGGIVAETEAAVVAATVKMAAAMAAKLRRLRQNASCGRCSLRDCGCGGGGSGSGSGYSIGYGGDKGNWLW